jgi:SulP family sulfate permease
MHALWLLLFMMLLAPLIVKIPLAALSAILIVVAWNMAEIKHLKSISKAPVADIGVLLVTFVLTVLVDLNIAIQAGISLASILFINSMMKSTKIRSYSEEEDTDDPDSIVKKVIPSGVEVYELDGPLFFGVAEKLVDILVSFETMPEVFILRLRHVPMIDAAGLHSLEVLNEKLRQNNSMLILSGVHKNVHVYLQKTKLDRAIGEENIVNHIDKALKRSQEVMQSKVVKI